MARQVNVLASCYLVDPTASLKGLHYCTTGAAGKDPRHPLYDCITSSADQLPIIGAEWYS